jgi:ATP-binding cassette subfamily F protein uup
MARRAEEEEAQVAGAARFRGSLRRELAWLRQGPKARSTKQKARLQRIEAMREQPVRQTKTALQMGSTARRLGKRAIEAENLAIQVGDRTLLEDFSHDFGPEDRIGIIGPNGVGKSSLLDAIAGRLVPSQGRLELGSTVRLAYFDQHSAALQASDSGRGAERKVIDVVQEEASRVEVDGVELSASLLLERFLFPPAQQHQPVARLSGGERQRAAVVRALINQPRLILADEPTGALDRVSAAEVGRLLLELNREHGITLIVATHSEELAARMDRVLSMENGALV